MRAEFEIIPHVSKDTDTDLVFEISESTCSFYLRDTNSQIINGLVHYRFNNMGTSGSVKESLDEILQHPSLNNTFRDVAVCYSYPESIICPRAEFIQGSEESLLELVHGECYDRLILKDDMDAENLVNIYRVPSIIHEVMIERFPSVKSIHQHTVLSKLKNENERSFEVLVYYDKLVVCIRKLEKLQFIKSFQYVSPDDAIYHLLNIRDQFELQNTPLCLSGLIENNSGLYRQIHKYFLSLYFSQLLTETKLIKEIEELPAHYFRDLFSISSCV